MSLSALHISPILSKVSGLSHDDVEILIEFIKGVFGLAIAYVSFRNKKDIDGVAEVVGTERAKARCDKKKKGCE